MDPELAARHKALLEAEGMAINSKGFVQNADDHFHVVGIRREIRWSGPP